MPACINKCRLVSKRWMDICIWNDKAKLAYMHSKLCKASP